MLAQASQNNGLMIALGVIFVINCVALLVFVLFRQSDSGGIGAAFGGGDGGGAFGTKGQAVVDKVITFMGGTFIVLALVFNLLSTGGTTGDTSELNQPQTETTQDGGE
jgi:preprotein translocase subunit SecG